jgi:hypothetical protein
MALNETQLTNFRKDFNEAMKTLEAKYAFKVQLGGIRYDSVHFSAKLEVTEAAVLQQDPHLNGADQKWITKIKKYSDTKDLFLKQFKLGASEYIIVGMYGNEKFITRRVGVHTGKFAVHMIKDVQAALGILSDRGLPSLYDLDFGKK